MMFKEISKSRKHYGRSLWHCFKDCISETCSRIHEFGDVVQTKRLSLKVKSAFQIELEFGNVGFWGEGKPEYPEKNLAEKRREPIPNSTHIYGVEWEATALNNHCAIPAPHAYTIYSITPAQNHTKNWECLNWLNPIYGKKWPDLTPFNLWAVSILITENSFLLLQISFRPLSLPSCFPSCVF